MTDRFSRPPPSAGWYADPSGRAANRWWDGTAWTTTVADGDVTRFDLFGVPLAAPPSGPPAAGPRISGPSGGDDAPTRSTLVTVTVAAMLAILVIALIVVVHHGDDRADADASARSALSDRVASLADASARLSRDASSLSTRVDELSSSAFPEFTDFTDFSSFTDFSTDFVDACSLLLPEDVAAALGAVVEIDTSTSFGPVCFLGTPGSSGGTLVVVNVGGPFTDLRTELRDNVPGTSEPRPVMVGDEAYVLDAYGVAVGIAAKGDSYVAIEVESGTGLPTDEQMVLLLQAAIARL